MSKEEINDTKISNSSAVHEVDKRSVNALVRHADTSEKAIERYLVGECVKRGWLCLKYANMTEAGYPDRLIVMVGGLTAWCEVKSAGQVMRPIQQRRYETLTAMGHIVHVCDSRAAVDDYILRLERYAAGL